MSQVVNGNPKRNGERSGWLFTLSIALLSVILITSALLVLHSSKVVRADGSSFVFTEAGDYGSTQYTVNNLQYIGKSASNGGSGASFNLGLGDYNYDTSIDANTWYSTYAQPNLPAGYPFEIVGGDHDTQLSELTADLPPNGITLGSQSTSYGLEYYFDYPANNPLARFIMLTPLIKLPNGSKIGYNYSAGSSHYNWVSQRISNARAAGIPWVIVGISRGCLYINTPSSNQACTQPDYDLLNLLLSKDSAGHPHADLILQAHLHYYARSYQLALNANCASLPIVPQSSINTFNSSCVADTSSNLTKDNGTVIVNTGTGGKSLVSINASDVKANYFAKWMGANSAKQGYGVSQFTISASQLSMSYILVSQTKGATAFQDGFTISSGSVPTPGTSPTTTPSVTPSPSATASPSPTPSPSPGSSIAQDTFQRPNQSYWGTASDGQTWGSNANSIKVFSINGNTGQVAGTSSNNYYATLGPPQTDAEVLFTGTVSDFTSASMGAVLRWTDSKDWYQAYIDGSNLVLQKKVAGTTNKLASVAFPATPNTSYILRFNISGTTLSAKVWAASGSEPSGWMVTTTDSSLSSGYCGLHVVVQSGTLIQYTSFQATVQ